MGERPTARGLRMRIFFVFAFAANLVLFSVIYFRKQRDSSNAEVRDCYCLLKQSVDGKAKLAGH
jgi:isocitrate dehydrogenase kinase/phosphatase